MVRSQTKIKKMIEANMLLEQRYLTKEDYDTVEPESEEDFPLEDEPSLFDDEEDEIEDYGFDVEDEDENDLEDFDKEMKFKDLMKKRKEEK